MHLSVQLSGGPPATPFIPLLFALTLLGVALFHHHTLRVALTGALTIILYKLIFTGFKTGPGVAGFLAHLGHEWVILANLFCLRQLPVPPKLLPLEAEVLDSATAA